MARATPADYREFVRVSVDLPDNPKLAMIDDPSAGWAYVVALCYCGRNLTDGMFPMAPLLRQAGVAAVVAAQLLDFGLWHESGHSCTRCAEPMPGMAVVHDYLEHQRSADEAKSLRDTRREAGRRGASSRWSAARDGDSDGKSHSKSHGNSHDKRDGKTEADGMANGQQVDGSGMAEGEGEGEEEKDSKKTSSSSSSAPADEGALELRRADIEALCNHLADRVEGNTAKRPNITKRWRTAARLLLDVDLAREQDPLGVATRVADWATNHEFWRTNVLSLPKFREQFTKLRMQARREWEQSRRVDDSGRHLAVAQPLEGTGTQRARAFLNLKRGDPA